MNVLASIRTISICGAGPLGKAGIGVGAGLRVARDAWRGVERGAGRGAAFGAVVVFVLPPFSCTARLAIIIDGQTESASIAPARTTKRILVLKFRSLFISLVLPPSFSYEVKTAKTRYRAVAARRKPQ
jgi:hypothetical protein